MAHEDAADKRSMRDAFGAFAPGVTIVTTRAADNRPIGMTANSFSSLSLSPPMVLWSLAKTSSSVEAFRMARHFAAHILASEQEDLSTRFATRGIDKFERIDLEAGPDAIPLLRECSGRFVCRTAFQHEGGDHVIIVGEVLDFTHSDKPPLIFHGGRYGTLLRREASAPEPVHPDSPLSPDDLILLLARGYYEIRRDATRARRRLGWSEAEYVAMSVLGRQDGQSLARIGAFLESRGVDFTGKLMEDLASRGLVTLTQDQDLPSRASLTGEGRRLIVRIMAMLKAGEADAAETLDPSEIRLLKQLLRKLAARPDPAGAAYAAALSVRSETSLGAAPERG